MCMYILFCFLQDHPYVPNIFKVLEGSSVVYKKLEEYTTEELNDFPEIVKVPHLWIVSYVYCSSNFQ